MSITFTNVAKFEKTLSEFASRMNVNIDIVIKKVAFDIYRGVTEKTPVDTGYARASWNISPNTIDSSVENEKAHTIHGEAGRAKAESVNNKKVQIANSKGNPLTWFITNNVKYIVELERGHSRQSSHMVRRTLNEVRFNLASILRDIKK